MNAKIYCVCVTDKFREDCTNFHEIWCVVTSGPETGHWVLFIPTSSIFLCINTGFRVHIWSLYDVCENIQSDQFNCNYHSVYVFGYFFKYLYIFIDNF